MTIAISRAYLYKKNGIKLYENYFNGYTADNAVHVFSVTKSVFSALIGIAIDKGLIKSADQKVLDFFSRITLLKQAKKNNTGHYA